MTIQITKLSNGLRVVTDPVQGIETVSLGVWVKVGSRWENLKNAGVAHFLEHMAFKGTQRRSALKIAQEIENVGGYLNAYTSQEVTAYYARVMKPDCGLAIDILGDILHESVFEASELERERGVILQEIAQTHDTPDDIIFDYLYETAFPNQPFGRPILGSQETVSAMRHKDLKSFMQGYSYENMVFVASGAVCHNQTVGQVEKTFQGLPATQEKKFEPISYQGGYFHESRKLQQNHLALAFPSKSLKENYFEASLYSAVLGGGMSSRLFQEIREKRGLAYAVYAYASAFSDGGLLSIYAGTTPEKALEAKEVIGQEMEKMTTSIEEEELSRAKAQLKASILMGLESMSSRAKRIGHRLLFFDTLDTVQESLVKIDNIRIKDLLSFAQHIVRAQESCVTIGPKNL